MILQARSNHYDLLLSNFAVSLVGWMATAAGVLHFQDALAGHYYQASLIALLHTFTLLTISPTILGVLYQLLPVVVESRLGSRTLAWITSLIWWSGATGFVISRLFLPAWMSVFAGLLFTAILTLIVQLIWTTGKGHWNSSAVQVLAATLWLMVMSVSGALMASGYYPVSAMRFLQWHAWTGVLGWFSLMIVALGTRLVPMFMLSHVSDGWARVSGFLLVIAPLILFGEAVLEERGFAFAGLLLVLASYAGFCFYLIQCIRKRMRRKLEAPMLLFFSSFLFPPLSLALIWGSLLPVGFLESSMESCNLAFAAMILILLGFVGSATLGMGFKILPFMSWMALQSGGGRTGGVPLPQDIGLRWIPGIIFFMYPLSVLALASGVLFPTIRLVGAVALIVSIALYSSYFIHLLLFLLRRRTP